MFRPGIVRCVLLVALGCGTGCQTTRETAFAPPPRFELSADRVWHLNPPRGGRFDASGILLRKDGELWTVSDRGSALYRIQFRSDADANEADLVELPGMFTAAQLRPYAAEKVDRYDCEGIAEDNRGRIYLCEEANRWILRFDPKSRKVERLEIDWSPVQRFFHAADRNASFEGVAIGGGRLYVANERQQGRIIVVNPATGRVVDDFSVRPSRSLAWDIHYSDLCWFEGTLFALLRENRCILQIEPKTHRVLAEYNFSKTERRSDFDYENLYGTSAMEGLAVDDDYFWLVTDNNGRPRRNDRSDTRPCLVRLPRPAMAAQARPQGPLAEMFPPAFGGRK